MTAQEEWRQGWRVVLAAAMGTLLMSAAPNTIGVFIKPLQAEFGWSRAELVTAMSIVTVVAAVATGLVGYAADKLGARRVGIAGAIFTCVSIAALSNVGGSIISYWIYWGLVAIGITLASTVIWTRGVVANFNASRGLALSISMLGSTLAGAVTPILTAYLILHYGWRTAYIGFAVGLFIVVLPFIFAFFHDARKVDTPATEGTSAPAQAAAVPTGCTLREALHGHRFWVLSVAFFLAGGATVSMPLHLIPLLQDRGLDSLQAAGAVSVISVTAFVARIAVGYSLDRIYAPYVAGAAYAIAVLGCILLALTHVTSVTAYAIAAMFGFAIGATLNLKSYVVARAFGLKFYGAIYGLISQIYVLGCAAIPPVVGLMYEWDGNYQNALFVLAGVFLASAVLLQFLRGYPDWSAAPQQSAA